MREASMEKLVEIIRGVIQKLETLLFEMDKPQNCDTFARQTPAGLAIVPSSFKTEATTMHVYWLGSGGLADLSTSLPGNPRVARIGCSTEPDIDVRLCSAKADAYGSWSRAQSGSLLEAAGFARWVMQAIRVTRASTDPTVIAKTRTIEVKLPPGMSRRQFDGHLHSGLAAWSLADQYPSQTRYTKYSMGVDRMSCAKEIYVGLDPRHDGDRLLGIIEDILKLHRTKAKNQDPKPSSSSIKRSAPRDHNNPTRTMSPAQIQAMRTRRRGGGK